MTVFRTINKDRQSTTVYVQGAMADSPSDSNVASLLFQNYDLDTNKTYDMAEIAMTNGSASNGHGELVFRTHDGLHTLERMRVRFDGNVGVGTSYPQSRLHVEGTTTALAFVGNGSEITGLHASNLNQGVVRVSNGGTGLATLPANKVLIGNGTDLVMAPMALHWDDSNLRLGVNNSNPAHAVDVRGDLNFTGQLLQHGIPYSLPLMYQMNNQFNGSTTGQSLAGPSLTLTTGTWFVTTLLSVAADTSTTLSATLRQETNIMTNGVVRATAYGFSTAAQGGTQTIIQCSATALFILTIDTPAVNVDTMANTSILARMVPTSIVVAVKLG
jgi:hypothetical protein